jgi:hypothetical protein
MHASALPRPSVDPTRLPLPAISGGSDDAGLVAAAITDASLCVECIARRSGVPVTRVDAVLTTIAMTLAVAMITTRCAACLETRRTFRLGTPVRRPGVKSAPRRRAIQEAILRFLKEHPGQTFCADCISRRLFAGKDIDVAMRHLEGNGVHRHHSQCVSCGKARLVASVPLSA